MLLNVIAPLSKRPIETVISKANELSAALRKTERVLMSGEGRERDECQEHKQLIFIIWRRELEEGETEIIRD